MNCGWRVLLGGVVEALGHRPGNGCATDASPIEEKAESLDGVRVGCGRRKVPRGRGLQCPRGRPPVVGCTPSAAPGHPAGHGSTPRRMESRPLIRKLLVVVAAPGRIGGTALFPRTCVNVAERRSVNKARSSCELFRAFVCSRVHGRPPPVGSVVAEEHDERAVALRHMGINPLANARLWNVHRHSE